MTEIKQAQARPRLPIGYVNVHPYTAGLLDSEAVPIQHLHDTPGREQAKTTRILGIDVALAESALANRVISKRGLSEGLEKLGNNLSGKGTDIFEGSTSKSLVGRTFKRAAGYALANTFGNVFALGLIAQGLGDGVQAAIYASLAGREEMAAARAVYFGAGGQR